MGDVVERPESPCGDAKSAATYDRASLESLLTKVEAATGPDHELDARLAVAIDPKRPQWAFDRGPIELEVLLRPGHNTTPYFTSSIDAALALVERVLPGWDIGVYLDKVLGATYPRAAGVSKLQGPNEGEFAYAQAHTPPLAIIAALLKALRARTPDQSVGRESDDAAPERTTGPGSTTS